MRAAGTRSRSAFAVLAVAAIATPLCVGAAGASARRAAAQDRAVVDTGYLYSQLYDLSTNYVYRVSGADGPPQDSSSPFNLPPTINGWQEAIADWKAQLTSTAAMQSGEAAFATPANHYFRRT